MRSNVGDDSTLFGVQNCGGGGGVGALSANVTVGCFRLVDGDADGSRPNCFFTGSGVLPGDQIPVSEV